MAITTKNLAKPQLGWRKEDADEKLFATLFRFGYFKNMHRIEFGKTRERWTAFV